MMTIRTRMAPSPTGEMHVGSLATVLKNYAFAKKHGGQFIVRIEDTDQAREIENGTQKILDVLKAYGLDYDEGPGKEGPYGPYIQSQRLNIYQEKAQQLLESGKAYYCTCSRERLDQVRKEMQANKKPPMYDKHCRNRQVEVKKEVEAGKQHVVRLAVPQGKLVSFTDLLRGEIQIQSDILDDQVLMKSDGFPTYHLAVVIDDHLMKISHIMRGEEWISSTPKHILLYQAFGWENEIPVYAHIPVYLNPDGKGKMSKRKGDVAAQSFLDKGYLPEAMLNFFMILGWAREDQTEIMTLDDYIQEFDPKDLSAKSVAFDLDKLKWLNGQYIRATADKELTKLLQPFLPQDIDQKLLQQVLPLVKDRLEVLSDISDLLSYFVTSPKVDQKLLLKQSKMTPAATAEYLEKVRGVLSALLEGVDAERSPAEGVISKGSSNWSAQNLEQSLRALQQTLNLKPRPAFMTIRVAVTGQTATPPLFDVMEVLGKEEVVSRLNSAINILNLNSNF